MKLVARVVSLQEAHRQVQGADGKPTISDDIRIGFQIGSADPDLDTNGSGFELVLPRILGKRWEIGMATNLYFEDITNGQEQTLSVVR